MWQPNEFKIGQKEKEFTALINKVKENNCETYLEIGARHGGAFFEMVTKAFPKGSTVIAVDLPGGTWGTASSAESLKKCVAYLNDLGYNAHIILGDSTSQEVQDKINKILPEGIDFTFIDGDHRYPGVKLDYETYLPVTKKLVAFHDIDGEGVRQKSDPSLLVEVPKLWKELKELHKVCYEFVDSEDQPHRPMGIGAIQL